MFVNPRKPSVCPGGHIKFPSVICEPFIWLQSCMPSGTITDIDGFTVDEEKKLVTGLLQKREYDPAFHKIFKDPDQVVDKLFSIENEQEWKLRYKLSEILGTELYAVFWPIDYPIKKYKIENPVIAYSVSIKDDEIIFKPLFYGDIENLTKLIRIARGRSFDRVKTLNVAGTKMECFLASNTKDPWPGNLDACVWDIKKDMFSAIVEFKTHNDPKYTIKGQYFGQWGAVDTRRYNVLDIIQKQLQRQNKDAKFIFAIWGTDKSHTEVKLQTIIDLKAYEDMYIKRPSFTKTTPLKFKDEFISYINKKI